MFFVVIGIVILIVSFVIALISLLREQKSLEKAVFESESEVNDEKVLQPQPDMQSIDKTPSLSEATNGILNDTDKEVTESQDSIYKSEDDVFPWEQNKPNEEISSAEKDEIERLKRELDILKAQPKDGSMENESPKMPLDSPKSTRLDIEEKPVEQKPVRKDLSGEISLGALRKGSDRF